MSDFVGVEIWGGRIVGGYLICLVAKCCKIVYLLIRNNDGVVVKMLVMKRKVH